LKKLKYEQFKLYAKRQNSSYFAENPRFMKFFKSELEDNNLGSIVKNNTELYQRWMAGFEAFKEE